MRILSRRDRAWLPGIALGGAWITHLVAYLIAAPDPHDRGVLLGSTGHGYLALAGPVVVSLLVASVVGFLIHRGRTWASVPAVRYTAIAGRLALLQVLTFLGVEATERLAHGLPLPALLQPPVAIGLVLQVVAACVAALVLFVLARAVEIIRRSLRHRPRATTTMTWVSRVLTQRRLVPASGGPTLRGPPGSVWSV